MSEKDKLFRLIRYILIGIIVLFFLVFFYALFVAFSR